MAEDGTEETVEEEEEKPLIEPDFGTVEYVYYWGIFEGPLPSPINVAIHESTFYECPPLEWFNFEIFPEKLKLTNTGYSVFLSGRWRTERPYLSGGSLMGKYVFSQLHFHWGADLREGSDHTVDGIRYPLEMHVVFFKTVYVTQEAAFEHADGVIILCYLIKYGVFHDTRLDFITQTLPKIQESQTNAKVEPQPLSRLLTMFHGDYFVYWGSVATTSSNKPCMWLVPRVPMMATEEQIAVFRSIWDPWDEPNLQNFRELRDKENRHLFLVNPRWDTWASLLPVPRQIPDSISVLSPAYLKHTWMIPKKNADLIPKPVEHEILN